ncbi:MAG: hypothetical protein Q7T36_16065 [Fluviicoccus sp.]|uniref:hypothetical protein n=1 Tax=Fluviicoccus sp. TaxID=2003552 RepID=UPI0027261983|nr:hypothetical protein [Fluviicoccus sp.]MDO8331981.1 hypothetical protein [Fluviicoccus sp.]
MNQVNTLKQMFVPALVVQLEQAEWRKCAPLTEAEVLRLRDQAIRFPVPASLVGSLEACRGFRDLSPGSIWEEWQERRYSLLLQHPA